MKVGDRFLICHSWYSTSKWYAVVVEKRSPKSFVINGGMRFTLHGAQKSRGMYNQNRYEFYDIDDKWARQQWRLYQAKRKVEAIDVEKLSHDKILKIAGLL